MKTYLKEGDEIIITWPAYQSLFELARSIGCKIKPWNYSVNSKTKEPYFSVDTFDSLIDSKTKLVIMNFPHNPTGFCLNKTELKRVIELSEAQNCMIFSDEMYRGLVVDESTPVTPSVCELTKNCVVLSGFSKTMSLPGIRLGWLVVQNETLMKQVIAYKDYTSICPPAPSEIIGLIALRNRTTLIGNNAQIIRKNVNFLREASKDSDCIEFYEQKTGSLMYVKVKVDDVDKFCEDLLQEGIALLPEKVFTVGGKDFKSCRVRFGTGRKDFPEVFAKFKRFWESYDR